MNELEEGCAVFVMKHILLDVSEEDIVGRLYILFQFVAHST